MTGCNRDLGGPSCRPPPPDMTWHELDVTGVRFPIIELNLDLLLTKIPHGSIGSLIILNSRWNLLKVQIESNKTKYNTYTDLDLDLDLHSTHLCLSIRGDYFEKSCQKTNFTGKVCLPVSCQNFLPFKFGRCPLSRSNWVKIYRLE